MRALAFHTVLCARRCPSLGSEESKCCLLTENKNEVSPLVSFRGCIRLCLQKHNHIVASTNSLFFLTRKSEWVREM